MSLANALTSLRFVFAVAMVMVTPFSPAFWACYLCGGLSDLLDGFVARKLHQQSKAGALLDSAADLIFAAAIFVVAVRSLSLPLWLWLCMGFVALLRLIGYGVGFYRFRAFSSLHTYLNKAAGAMIFAFPLLYALLGPAIAGAAVCVIAFVSSVEELAITVKSKELNRDCKGFFCNARMP